MVGVHGVVPLRFVVTLVRQQRNIRACDGFQLLHRRNRRVPARCKYRVQRVVQRIFSSALVLRGYLNFLWNRLLIITLRLRVITCYVLFHCRLGPHHLLVCNSGLAVSRRTPLQLVQNIIFDLLPLSFHHDLGAFEQRLGELVVKIAWPPLRIQDSGEFVEQNRSKLGAAERF